MTQSSGAQRRGGLTRVVVWGVGCVGWRGTQGARQGQGATMGVSGRRSDSSRGGLPRSLPSRPSRRPAHTVGGQRTKRNNQRKPYSRRSSLVRGRCVVPCAACLMHGKVSTYLALPGVDGAAVLVHAVGVVHLREVREVHVPTTERAAREREGSRGRADVRREREK